MPEIDLGRVIGPQGPQGETGPTGAQGIQGEPGAPATVNGFNTVTIEAGENINIQQNNGSLTIGVEITPDEIGALPSTGGTLSGDLTFSKTGIGVTLTDKTGFSYPGVLDTGSNLVIGSVGESAKHHAGHTFISAGYNQSGGNGYESAYVLVPNASNTGATSYRIIHEGNLKTRVTPAAIGALGAGGTAVAASAVKDAYNETDITIRYGGDPVTSAKWFAVWDGYSLRAINAANMRSALGFSTESAMADAGSASHMGDSALTSEEAVSLEERNRADIDFLLAIGGYVS